MAARARARHVWTYDQDEGLLVDFVNGARGFGKAHSKDIKQLVYSANYQIVPQGTADLYYAAQLLHYGLPPAAGVDGAVGAFKDAFARLAPGTRLTVPQALIKLKSALKVEYQRETALQETRVARIRQELDELEAVKQKALQRQNELELELKALNSTCLEEDNASDDLEEEDDAPPAMAEDEMILEQQAVDSGGSTSSQDIPHGQKRRRSATPAPAPEAISEDEVSSSASNVGDEAIFPVEGAGSAGHNTRSKRAFSEGLSDSEQKEEGHSGTSDIGKSSNSPAVTKKSKLSKAPTKIVISSDTSANDSDSSELDSSDHDDSSSSVTSSDSSDCSSEEEKADLRRSKRQRLDAEGESQADAGTKLNEAKSTRKQQCNDQSSSAEHFFGFWKLQHSFSRKPRDDWLRITERYICDPKALSARTETYIGKVRIQGHLTAYIIAANSPILPMKANDSHKISFLWSALPEKPNGLSLEGKLEMCFEGNRVEGAMSGDLLESTITFRGTKEADTWKSSKLEYESMQWWSKYSSAKYKSQKQTK